MSVGSARSSGDAETRVAYVLCYRDPQYVRTVTLTRALESIPGVELQVVTNGRRGLSRYAEVLMRAVRLRLGWRPDVWIVGFRGHEVFGLLYPLMAGRRIVFDEFVNLHGWLVEERRVLRASSGVTRLLDAYVRWVMAQSAAVLTDTDAQADYSSRIYGIPRSKFVVVPVGTDERTFSPRPTTARSTGRFEVLSVGTMLPLHGTSILLDAIRLLREQDSLDSLHFTLIGGRGKPAALAEIAELVRDHRLEEAVTHLPWVDYAQLPAWISSADLCIGGPLGDTPQARRVVTGKTYQFLAMGRPVLVGRGDATTEFVDRENCLLVRQGSPEAVAAAIRWAAGHPDEMRTIAARGRELFERRFAAPQVAAALRRALVR